MYFDFIKESISSFAILIVGVLMRFFKEAKYLGGFEKYWFYFILLGVISLIIELAKFNINR